MLELFTTFAPLFLGLVLIGYLPDLRDFARNRKRRAGRRFAYAARPTIQTIPRRMK